MIKKVNVFGEITLKIELCLVTAAKKEGKIIVLIFIILRKVRLTHFLQLLNLCIEIDKILLDYHLTQPHN